MCCVVLCCGVKCLQNDTCVFNLYGITEVSCWASCETVTADKLKETGENERSGMQLVEEEERREMHACTTTCVYDECKVEERPYGLECAVSLGQPLDRTVLELRDNNGEVISANGYGHIWIG